ncbi:hypothetical protein EV682_104290 [Iodobacter fluviatilis]|uniref:Uncharacterized protein n=1 Tax=Iodobacter fluviatilis TaxID=537 RepID=A0A377SZ51_9NEIS|nr:hypothetical protein EV682_104290 [Iodobacter fluviatilis]STR45616.1 Uncharacterised protein [Iodobacter fluviatilis]
MMSEHIAAILWPALPKLLILSLNDYARISMKIYLKNGVGTRHDELPPGIHFIIRPTGWPTDAQPALSLTATPFVM